MAFLNPREDIQTHRRNNLPHWQQDSVWCFATWRLADSLPAAKLAKLREDRKIWSEENPPPLDPEQEAEYHKLFSTQIEDWLDQGSGKCVLRDPEISEIVSGALRHFSGKRYNLARFVVMPNHVHVLFEPLADHTIADIVKSWKGFTAREINKKTGSTGSLWQKDYFDRLIRNEKHYYRVIRYIEQNPKKANLREGEYVVG